MKTSPPGSCRTVLADISAYLDGDLDAAACAAIERHARACPRCATFVEGLGRTIGLCRDAGSAPLPAAIRAKARAYVRRLMDSFDGPDAA